MSARESESEGGEIVRRLGIEKRKARRIPVVREMHERERNLSRDGREIRREREREKRNSGRGEKRERREGKRRRRGGRLEAREKGREGKK